MASWPQRLDFSAGIQAERPFPIRLDSSVEENKRCGAGVLPGTAKRELMPSPLAKVPGKNRVERFGGEFTPFTEIEHFPQSKSLKLPESINALEHAFAPV
ncbi:hypothetical protein [Geothrix sp. 21YS21S-2]|uniref:hypothetical protein n=1 Tax=Geothrix sp. 21YS21S-2 TaxID=3068893 RepID=UPI0027B96051|nr:hypothetical protein [Geothrix sp. 21YS21S-2]